MTMILEQASKADPKSFLMKAQRHAAAGDAAKAFAACRLLAHVSPRHAEANYNMAAILLQRNNPIGALGYAINAWEAEQGNPLYRLALATALRSLSAFDTARTILAPIKGKTGLGPNADQIRTDMAAAQAKGAKTLKPVPVDLARVEQAAIEWGLETTQFRDLVLAMILDNREEVGLWQNLTSHLVRTKKYAGAEGAARRALALAPENGDIHAALAFVHESMGESRFAGEIFQRAQDQLEPTTKLVHQHVGFLIRLGKHRWKDAEALADRYSDMMHSGAAQLVTYAQAKDLAGKYDESFALMEEALEKVDSDTTIYLSIVHFFLQQDAIGKAREAAELALERQGEDPAILGNLVLVADAEGNSEEVIRLLGLLENKQLSPDMAARCQFAAGAAYGKVKDYEKSLEAYTAANLLRRRINNADYKYKPDNFIKNCDLTEAAFKRSKPDQWTSVETIRGFPRHAFIYGLPRSGTTLLDTLLRSHPETTLLEEEPVLNQSLTQFMKQHKNGWDAFGTISQSDADKLQKNYRDGMNALMGRHAGPEDYVIDRNPLNTSIMGAAYRFFPDSRHVFIARHPLDVVLSGFMQDFALSDPMANYLDLERAAMFYDANMRAFDAVRQATDLDIHIMRYEDLIADTEGEMRRLLEHLDLPWTDSVVDNQASAAGRERIRTASHAQVRKPIYKSARYRWKNYRFGLDQHIPMLERWIDYFGYES